jgi:hypothetical protein
MRRTLILAAAWLCAGDALAEVSVYSARPDSVSVTIYREGIALVTETRSVELPQEPVTLVFQAVVDSLLPRSAVMNGAGRPVAATDFRFDQLTPASLLQQSVGKVVTIVRTSPRTGTMSRLQAEVVSADHGVVLRTVQGNEALYCSGLPERLEFSEIPGGLTPTPTLSVQLAGGMPGRRTITISYLAAGFSWSADYVARLNASSTRMHLSGWITLRNDTGSAFDRAQVQVVAGRLHLLDGEDDGSRPARMPVEADEVSDETGLPVSGYDALRAEESEAAASEFIALRDCYPVGGKYATLPDIVLGAPNGARQATDEDDLELMEVQVTGSRIVDRVQLGDYQLYRLPWRTDLGARQTKQAAFLDKADVKTERFYSITVPWIGATTTYPEDAPAVTLRLHNEAESGLGEPLPAGQVRVFEPQADGEVFAGEARVGDSPTGVPVEIAIARALDLAAEFRLDDDSSRESSAHVMTVRASHRFVNHKDAAVQIEVRQQNTPGFSTPAVVHSTVRPKRERGSLVWRMSIPAGAEVSLRYELKARKLQN